VTALSPDLAPDLSPDLSPDLAPAAPGAVSPPWDRRRITLTVTAVVGAGVCVWAWRHLDMTLAGIVEGSGHIWRLVGRMTPPTFRDLDRTIELAVETFFTALLGTVVATVISVPVGVLAASNTTINRWTQAGVRGLIALCRAVPDLVFAFIFVRAIGIGVLPGVLALAFHSVGMIGKLFADAIETVDEGPREAVRAAGGHRLHDITTAVLPQVQPSWIGTFLYRLDINLRTSVVLGLVGAGGIGFALQSTLRALQYDAAMGIVLVIAVMIVAVEVFSSAMRRSLLGDETVGTPRRVEAAVAGVGRLSPPWTAERRRRTGYAAVLLVGIAYAFASTDVSPVELVTSVPDIVETAGRLFPPGLGGMALDELFEPMLVTVAVGLVSTALAVVVAIPLGFLAARNVAPFRWLAGTVRVSLVGWRAIPELILAVVFVAAIGLGPVGGVLALALGSIPFLAKLVADSVEEVDPGPRDAVDAVGAGRLQETVTAVTPQVTPALVGHVLYLLDVNIRSSTILGIVGGGGIGFLLFNSMRVMQYEVTGAILLLIFVTIFVIEQISGWLRRKLI
jgi:phosphonate transport system permease protein